ncbi:HAD family hydrolase [Pedobacter steynii]|nr:hypothetical protein [Pedobacter steynii]
MEHLLKIAGLLTFFGEDRIFSNSDPLIFFDTARSIGFEPAECAVVDRSDIGLDLARKGDFCVLGMDDGTNRTKLENKGILVFNEFPDLIELIDLFNAEVELEIKRY